MRGCRPSVLGRPCLSWTTTWLNPPNVTVAVPQYVAREPKAASRLRRRALQAPHRASTKAIVVQCASVHEWRSAHVSLFGMNIRQANFILNLIHLMPGLNRHPPRWGGHRICQVRSQQWRSVPEDSRHPSHLRRWWRAPACTRARAIPSRHRSWASSATSH